MTEKDEDRACCPLCQLMSWSRDSETAQHLRNARKEVLLALKTVIEAGIERLDKESSRKGEGPARKVEIS